MQISNSVSNSSMGQDSFSIASDRSSNIMSQQDPNFSNSSSLGNDQDPLALYVDQQLGNKKTQVNIVV